MTLDEVKAMETDFITPAVAGSVMKMDPGRVVWYAKNGQLPFPAVISGNRVKIPRAGFLKFFGVEMEEKSRQQAEMNEIAAELREIRLMLAEIIGRREAV